MKGGGFYLRVILSILLGIFVIMFIGQILLTEFPALQPLFEQAVDWVSEIWFMLVNKYGVITAGVLVVGILILFSTSKRG